MRKYRTLRILYAVWKNMSAQRRGIFVKIPGRESQFGLQSLNTSAPGRVFLVKIPDRESHFDLLPPHFFTKILLNLTKSYYIILRLKDDLLNSKKKSLNYR